MTTFAHTRAALAVYDAGVELRQDHWDAAHSVADLDACAHEEAHARRLVQVAFYRDTSHINSLEHCLLVDIEFARRTVALPETSQG